MTAMVHSGPGLRVTSVTGTARRLSELLRERRGRAQWWVELARQLDELSMGLVESAEQTANRRGLADQIRRDAPHLLGRLRRLDGELDLLVAQTASVRLLIAEYAGDPLAVHAVSRAVLELTWRVGRYQEKTSEMLLDAYARDMGGE